MAVAVLGAARTTIFDVATNTAIASTTTVNGCACSVNDSVQLVLVVVIVGR